MTGGSPKAVADLVFRAGGQVVGRTRLHKSACLLELTGLGYGFRFHYRLYGPFSDELQLASDDAGALGLIKEQKHSANWGGVYYSFSSRKAQVTATPAKTRARQNLLKVANGADPVELELAVTAAFLAANGHSTPWEKVAQRKPSKATDERMNKAKKLYQAFSRVSTPKALPKIV